MKPDTFASIERRDFLKLASAVTVMGLTHNAFAAAAGSRIGILIDSSDPIASGAPVTRAAEKLRAALETKGSSCEIMSSADQAGGFALCIVVAGASSSLAKSIPASASPTGADSLRIAPGELGQTPATFISATDTRGFVYGLLELEERVRFNPDLGTALHVTETIEEKPSNDVRSVGRYFCSELQDKSWYYDKDFWRGYLDTLVTSRFNRFNFGYGLEYDFPRGVTSDYFHFVYPYLFDVPGYNDVRVLQLASPDGTRLAAPAPLSKKEQAKNFEMLRFIAAETGARGLHFQLGIWTHAYKWTDSPDAYHSIEGLTPETHAAYCRDALAIILKECPEIQGLTLRVHGESGIPEGSYPFWKTLFEAIAGCGRQVEIDMHAKGVNQIMIDMAAATGMPVKLGAKYSAEHQSLGYNQTDIRALEIPHPISAKEAVLFSLSSGTRSFTRYGYADFLHRDSKYQLLFRLWPGTQRHLLSADPEMAAAYSRTSHFCGTAGLDLMEPLTFKGREGSGVPGGRLAYADRSLNPKADWQKFEYYYRVWGRKLYNPNAEPETWSRYLRAEFGPGAIPLETSLANASRLLPLITSSHLSSASNHDFWPEIQTNMPIVLGSEPSPYGDTPTPKCFGTVSPLDPQIFSTVVECSEELLAGRPSAKYSPIEVAQWLEDFANVSASALASARKSVRSQTSPEFRRIEADILIQNGVGLFFASKLRSAVLFEIFLQTGSSEAGNLALTYYKKARETWSQMATRANSTYLPNVSYGDVPKRKGHWSDRLPAIDIDLAAMQAKLQSTAAPVSPGQDAAKAIRAARGKPARPIVDCTHIVPASFHPGQPLPLSLAISSTTTRPTSMRLFYRHVNQAERWLSVEMQNNGGTFRGSIPGDYTQSIYPLQYYFEIEFGNATASLFPPFNATLSNQPYCAISARD